MNRMRSRIRAGLLLGGMLGAAAIVTGSVLAQTYPSKPIEFVAHTSAGSGTDLFGRNVSGLLEKERIFSQPFTHSNRTGGLGAVAFNYIKSKRGDPHVVLTVATGSILNAASRPELELPLSTFTPLAFFAQDPQAIAVRAASKIGTIPDLIEAAKREPTGLTVGLTSAVGVGRFVLYLLERDTAAKFRIISFKGGGDAVLATLGGHVEITAENLSEMLALYETKKMRVLAVTGERRFARALEVPTLKELGFNIVAATGGIIGHKSNPAELRPSPLTRRPGGTACAPPFYTEGAGACTTSAHRWFSEIPRSPRGE